MTGGLIDKIKIWSKIAHSAWFLDWLSLNLSKTKDINWLQSVILQFIISLETSSHWNLELCYQKNSMKFVFLLDIYRKISSLHYIHEKNGNNTTGRFTSLVNMTLFVCICDKIIYVDF